MSKTSRRTLGFDSLEGKVLLSTGLADPAATIHLAKVKRFLLNGVLHGLPFGTIRQNGFAVSSFPVLGKAQSMGQVSGSLELANPFIAQGKRPDLNGARLTLSNSKGSVQLMMASSP